MTSIASRAAAASPTRPWPADRVDQWPIERLIPYPNTPGRHSAADVERIAAAILKWGWTNPVLVDEQGVLIAGHGRVAAAAKLGLTVPIPVIVARGWSEEEKQAYRLADNELAARGSWDPDLLRSELGDLKFSGFDLDLIGFEPDRLEAILAGLGASGLSDPDSVPQVPGDHAVAAGVDVGQLAESVKAVACLTKDREALLAFFDFPAEHWDHLRTSNPIESVFATVRHRTVRTKGALSAKPDKLMVFKLVNAAAKTWRRLKGENQLPKVVHGVKFQNGIEVIVLSAHHAA